MTVKQLTTIVNGRLVPTSLQLDADQVELSQDSSNAISIKDDGLFYKEPEGLDGLQYREDGLGIGDYSIALAKVEKHSSSETATPVSAELLQSLEDHLKNLYSHVKKLKGVSLDTSSSSVKELSDNLVNIQSRVSSVYKGTTLLPSPKTYTTTVTADADGNWSVDYSHVGFTTIPVVICTGVAVGTALADKRFASLVKDQPTLKGAVGYLHSSSSAGLLAAMTMVAGAGVVHVVAIGY